MDRASTFIKDSPVESVAALVVEFRGFLQTCVAEKVVLDPQLGAGFCEKRFNRISALMGLCSVIFESRNALESSGFGKMIKIA